MIKQAGMGAALAAIFALGAVGGAWGDTYTVRGCAAGWEAHADQGAAATDACATGGGLTAQLVGPGRWGGGPLGFHRFTAPARGEGRPFAFPPFPAPAGTRITRLTLGRVTQGMTVGTVRTFSYTLSA